MVRSVSRSSVVFLMFCHRKIRLFLEVGLSPLTHSTEADKHDKHGVYGRRELLSLYSAALAPSHDMQSRLRSLGLWTVCRLKAGRVYRYRGRRAGRQRRPLPTTRRLDNGTYVITGNRPNTPAYCTCRSTLRVYRRRTGLRLPQHPLSDV